MLPFSWKYLEGQTADLFNLGFRRRYWPYLRPADCAGLDLRISTEPLLIMEIGCQNPCANAIDVYMNIYIYRHMYIYMYRNILVLLLMIIIVTIILITIQTDVHLQKLCKVSRVLTHPHIKLHSSASQLACEVNGTWTGFTWSESSMVSGCKRRKCKRWRQYTQHDFSCCVFEEVSGGFPQHWGLIHHQLWVE